MKNRDLNVDLCRITAAFLAIILHVLGQGGILQAATPDTAVYRIAWLMEIGAYCAVNCFALISGYVMVNKTARTKSILNLWFQVLFYSLSISSVFFVFVPETRTFRNLVVAFVPVLGNQWWYISSYFALFFFIPVLNTAIAHISKKEFEKLLCVILVGVCILDCIIPIDAFVLYGGYSPIWLIILYLFGAYIKKHDLKQEITAIKSILFFCAVVILTFFSKLSIRHLGYEKYEDIFISYTSITIVLAAIFLFLFCLNINPGTIMKKLIALFSPAALGVYLIHVHPLVFRYIIKDAFIGLAGKPVFVMATGVLAASLMIFFLCSVAEFTRIKLFKILNINRLSEIIDNKIQHLCLKHFKE